MTTRLGSADPNPNPDLGPLAQLQGKWSGDGFNLISLPVQRAGQPPGALPFRLKLNATREQLDFSLISTAKIPNRGFGQPDQEFLGLQYLQAISDRNGEGGLHVEPGLWLFAPDPQAAPSLFRLATVPHGDAFLASNPTAPTPRTAGAPTIPSVDPRPFPTGQPNQRIAAPGYLAPFLNAPLPTGLEPAIPPVQNADGTVQGPIGDPNLVLRAANAGKTFNWNESFTVSSDAANLRNIPFVQRNANATSMTATFWVSEVQRQDGAAVLQLQYSQTVILNFDNVDWPHVSVATLTMAFG